MHVKIQDVDTVLDMYGVDGDVREAVHDLPRFPDGREMPKSRWIVDKRYLGRNKVQVFCAVCGRYEKRSRNAYYKHGERTGMKHCPGCAAEMEGE